MKPFNIYTVELVTRSLYFLFSYTLCLITFFYKIDILFLAEVYPLLTLENKRFIVTNLTDFIDIVWFLSIFMSTFFIFPLFFYHVKAFFCGSWYIYQFKLYKQLVLTLFFIFFITFFIIHYLFLPIIFKFFTYWEIKEESSLLRIETETTLVSYILWTLCFKSVFCSFLGIITFIGIIFLYFTKINQMYIFSKYNKNIFIFFFIFFSFLITPPDFFTQLLIVIGNFFIGDILFFFICMKLYKSNCILN